MSRKAREAAEKLQVYREHIAGKDDPAMCPLCGRLMPEEYSDEHHLVPKSKGGKHTRRLHKICHRHLHALFSEAELAKQYSTLEALLAHPEVQRFVAWVKTKPPGFSDSSKRSHRRK